MQFKVGDKVRIIKYHIPHIIGKEGIITEIRKRRQDFPYKVNFYDGWLPLKASEIEHVVIENQQLLFDFMLER